MARRGATQFAAADMQPLYLSTAASAAASASSSAPETGQWKISGGLTYVQIEAAGHMVPLDQPAAGYFALDTILRTLRPQPPPPPTPAPPLLPTSAWVAAAVSCVATALAALGVHAFVARRQAAASDEDSRSFARLSAVEVDGADRSSAFLRH